MKITKTKMDGNSEMDRGIPYSEQPVIVVDQTFGQAYNHPKKQKVTDTSELCVDSSDRQHLKSD